jgi:hypothetical protein
MGGTTVSSMERRIENWALAFVFFANRDTVPDNHADGGTMGPLVLQRIAIVAVILTAAQALIGVAGAFLVFYFCAAVALGSRRAANFVAAGASAASSFLRRNWRHIHSAPSR